MMLQFLLSFSLFSQVIDIPRYQEWSNNWFGVTSSPTQDIRRLIQLVQLSPKGRSLVEEASKKSRKEFKDLYQVIMPGQASFTDTTMSRRYTMNNPEGVEYIQNSTIFINKELSLKDAVLDLAHELIHYTYRGTFNPYIGKLNRVEYIKNNIEGKGSEVEALVFECEVSAEIFKNHSSSRPHCQKILNEEEKLDYSLALKLFYQMGREHSEFIDRLGSDRQFFPFISNEDAYLISSAANRTYPMAILEEFEMVLKKVCANEKSRYSFINQKNVNRSPASAPPPIPDFLKENCLKVL